MKPLFLSARRRPSIPAFLSVAALLTGTACSRGEHVLAQAEGADPAVVAKVGAVEITSGQLEEAASAELEQIETQRRQLNMQADRSRHAVLEQRLEQLVRDELLRREAEQRGVEVAALESEIETKIEPVTDGDIDSWYTQNQARLRGQSKEQVAPQIRQLLEQERDQEVREAYFEELKGRYDVDYRLDPFRVEVAEGPAPARGPDTAPVTIVEFSDFECPYCKRVLPAIEQVMTEFDGKVRLTFRQFPLQIHANAQKAAEASLCAADQGKFWEMHDLLFAEQQSLAVPDLKAKAGELGIGGAAFDDCLDSGRFADQVAADMTAGGVAGVSGTPALFVNGRFINGAVPFEDIAEVVRDEIERAGS